MKFSRLEYCSRLPFPPLGDPLNPGIKPMSPASSALAGGVFTADLPLESKLVRIFKSDFLHVSS